jgi:CMP-N-acetylneuraminic acid synthetase
MSNLQSKEVLALVPARSGSKSIIDKNIRPLRGKPMLAWSIEHARSAKSVTRVIVSTDSEQYAGIARELGAETPFLRPPEFSGDMATDWEVFHHALNWLQENEGWAPDICVHLRPTHPVRNPKDIDHMVEILINHREWDSVRSVVAAPETPFKMWFRDAEGMLSPVIQTEIREAYNQPRQSLPPTYLQNASIDVVRSRVILEQRSMTGRNIHGYLMEASFDIDNEVQLEIARQHLETSNARLVAAEASPPRTFVFDIDGVIANLVPSLDYALATPNQEAIRMVNFLYDLGHRVLLFTARGSQTGKDWSEITRHQMGEWGVKYHELRFGKPAADYYVDDRMLSIEALTALALQWGLDRANQQERVQL